MKGDDVSLKQARLAGWLVFPLLVYLSSFSNESGHLTFECLEVRVLMCHSPRCSFNKALLPSDWAGLPSIGPVGPFRPGAALSRNCFR